MRIEAKWQQGGSIEVGGDFNTLAKIQFTTEGRQLTKRVKLDLLVAALNDLREKPEDAFDQLARTISEVQDAIKRPR